MPFKSKRQARKFFAMEARGELPEGTAKRWAHETKSIKKLPEKVKKAGLRERFEGARKGTGGALSAAGLLGGAAVGAGLAARDLRRGKILDAGKKLTGAAGTGWTLGSLGGAAAGAARPKTSAAYKLQGRMEFQGMPISIENRKGSVRRWFDPHGNEKGSTHMHWAYGYIRGTRGTDGDHVDVYIGPNPDATHAFVVDQMKKPEGAIKKDGKPWKEFDEQKCMLGWDSAEEAKAAYLKQYDDPRFFGGLKAIPMEEFKEKVMAKANHGKKVAELRLRMAKVKTADLLTQISRYAKNVGKVPNATRKATNAMLRSQKAQPLKQFKTHAQQLTERGVGASKTVARKKTPTKAHSPVQFARHLAKEDPKRAIEAGRRMGMPVSGSSSVLDQLSRTSFDKLSAAEQFLVEMKMLGKAAADTASGALSESDRDRIKAKNFAIPKQDKYPIHDADHARNALTRVAQHGTPEEQKRVRAAVARKWPGIDQEKESMLLDNPEDPLHTPPTERKKTKKASGDMLAYFRDHPEKLREKRERDRRKAEKRAALEKVAAELYDDFEYMTEPEKVAILRGLARAGKLISRGGKSVARAGAGAVRAGAGAARAGKKVQAVGRLGRIKGKGLMPGVGEVDAAIARGAKGVKKVPRATAKAPAAGAAATGGGLLSGKNIAKAGLIGTTGLGLYAGKKTVDAGAALASGQHGNWYVPPVQGRGRVF